MPKFVTGADFKAFYNDPEVWDSPADSSWYIDDLHFVVNGEDMDIDDLYQKHGESFENLPDDARLTRICGFIEWQGRGNPPSDAPYRGQVADAIDLWLKNRATHTIVATIEVVKGDQEALDEVVRALEGLGAKFNTPDQANDKPSQKAPSP